MEESEKKQLVSSWRRVGRSWSFSTTTTSLEEVETTTTATSVGHAAGALLSRSYSATNTDAGGSRGSAAVVVKKRLSRKVKEQRARLYIARRCVSMLLCWRDPDDN